MNLKSRRGIILGAAVITIGAFMIATRPSGAGPLWPAVAIATKSQTYDIYDKNYPTVKAGELTITVRKYTNQVIVGVTGLTYYELDDDITLEITNNTYKSRPAPLGNEPIPLRNNSDMILGGSEDFITGKMGTSKFKASGVDGKWFSVGTKIDAGQSWSLDDWWANPSSTAVWHWSLTYFNENMNCEVSPGEYAEMLRGETF